MQAAEVAGERLLKPAEVAGRLGVSLRTFRHLEDRLIAQGLRAVTVGGGDHRQHRRYVASSVDDLIRRAARRESLC